MKKIMKFENKKRVLVSGFGAAALLVIAACGSGLPTSSSSSSPSTGGGGGGSSPGTSIVRTLGGAASAQIRNLVVDSSGNSYVAGVYTNDNTDTWGTKDFGGGSLLGMGSTASQDAYLAKINSSGTQLWIRTFGGSGTDTPFAPVLDAAGNIYLTMYFENDLGNTNGVKDFAGNALAGLKGSVKDVSGVFKLDANGNQQWFKLMGGNAASSASAVAVDASNNVYVAGSYDNDSADLNSVVDYSGAQLLGLHNTTNSLEAYVAKLDSSGNQIWIKVFGGTGSDSALNIVLDASGNVFAAGQVMNDSTNTGAALDFNGSAMFGKSATPTFDAWIAKLNSSGTQQWMKVLGGDGTLDSMSDLAVDSLGNVYIGGVFENSSANAKAASDFGGAILLGKSSSSSSDAYLAKLDTSGAQQWIRTLGGAATDLVNAVTTDTSNNVYAVGGFTNSSADANGVLNFSGAALLGKASSSTRDGFAVKFNSSGVQQNIAVMGGSGTDSVFGVKVTSGMVIVSGAFNNSSGDSKSVVGFANTSLVGRSATATNNNFVERFSF